VELEEIFLDLKERNSIDENLLLKKMTQSFEDKNAAHNSSLREDNTGYTH